MSERQQPGLSTDTGTGYRRGGGGSGKRSNSNSSGGGGGRLLGNMIMAVLVAGLVMAGWFIANQQEMLAAEQARLSQASDRIQALENRLIATDSALSQGGQDTQTQTHPTQDRKRDV